MLLQLKEGRRTGALALKVGMLSIYDKWGVRHAVSVLQLDDCRVLQHKTTETDGYNAVQLGVGEVKWSRVKGTVAGVCKKAGVSQVKRLLAEFRISPDSALKPGTQIPALHFVPGQVSLLFDRPILEIQN
jgi:large subunit ribosomal protein L3